MTFPCSEFNLSPSTIFSYSSSLVRANILRIYTMRMEKLDENQLKRGNFLFCNRESLLNREKVKNKNLRKNIYEKFIEFKFFKTFNVVSGTSASCLLSSFKFVYFYGFLL